MLGRVWPDWPLEWESASSLLSPSSRPSLDQQARLLWWTPGQQVPPLAQALGVPPGEISGEPQTWMVPYANQPSDLGSWLVIPQRPFLSFFFFFFPLECSWFKMLCQFLLYSKMPQSYIYTYIYIYIYSFSHTTFYHGQSQETGQSSLCCTAGPHCLSILNAIVCIYQPQTPRPSYSLPLPLATTSLFSMSVSLFAFRR